MRVQVIDLFAGGGGASEGIRQALGVSPALAIDIEPAAVRTHQLNHPDTTHLTGDLLRIAPRKPWPGEDVDLLWASPKCTDFSRARGGRQLCDQSRSLPWTVVEWARYTHPRVIVVENVPEWSQWGPLGEDGRPVPERRGETFLEFVLALREEGYEVEHRVLCAADYGAPTTRRRLFLAARRDGKPVRWPEPTHGPGRALPWRTAAECVDWSIPCPSIFDRSRPPAEATRRRIAEGIRRYVLAAAQPFVVRTDMQSDGRLRGVAPIGEPLRTVTTSGGHAVVAPTLIQTGYGERDGQAPRALDLHQPLGTVVAGGRKHGLVTAFLARHNGGPHGGAVGSRMSEPVATITSVDSKAVVTASLSTGPHARRVAALLTKYYGTGSVGQSLGDPAHTISTRDRFGLVTVEIDGETHVICDVGMRMLEPRELARAQGFPDDYQFDGTKAEQTARIGNSVCPPVARAIARALLGPTAEE